MKQIIFLFIAIILITSCISAEIIINQQPAQLYNIGDIVKTSFKVITSSDLDPDTFFSINTLCNGIETKIVQIPVGDLSAGEERLFNPPIPLLASIIGRTTGTCKIKAVLQSLAGEEYEYSLTNDFQISDSIIIELKIKKQEYAPEEGIEIEGNAIKENGDPVKGIIEFRISEENKTLVEKMDTVTNGYFYINFSLPKETKSDEYPINIDVYEINKNSEKTNQGHAEYSIIIQQVPTNLEIIFENQEIEPGSKLKVKAILHDQVGEQISSEVNLTIRKQEKLINQIIKPTDEFFEMPINYNEPPAEWEITAISNKLKTEANCKILEKEDVKVELINKTLTITNKGNVFYNKSVSVTIGNESLEVDVALEVDESQTYILNAPDGEYQVKVNTEEGTRMEGIAMLTGKAIEIKEPQTGISSFFSHPLVWIFIIIILGLVAFLVFKKGHKRIFFGHAPSHKKEKKKNQIQEDKSLLNTKSKAELSLSIKGAKQDVSLVCLKLKNFQEIKDSKQTFQETLNKLEDAAVENKALIYENHDCLFFILSAIKTRTFRNERSALKLSQKIQDILYEHNKIFKQQFRFGISLNYGTIIGKKEKDSVKFMSMGTLITNAKKIASLSSGEIFLSEKINSKLGEDIKTEKHQKDKVTIYKIREFKDREKNRKFINNFVRRMEKDNQSKK